MTPRHRMAGALLTAVCAAVHFGVALGFGFQLQPALRPCSQPAAGHTLAWRPGLTVRCGHGRMKEDFRVRAVKRISRRERVLCLSAALDSFSSDDGIDWCRIGYEAEDSTAEKGVDMEAMGACLSYSGRRVEWVGDEPRTEGGKAWRRLAHYTSLPPSSLSHSMASAGVSGEDEEESDAQSCVRVQSILKDSFLSFPDPRIREDTDAERVVDAYSKFLGTPPPPHSSAADLQLAEIPLFTINKVLLPGVDFPLQIDKRNFAGKEMMDTIAASDSRQFGVVTTPAFRTRPSETLTERTLADYTPSSSSASGGGPSGAEGARTEEAAGQEESSKPFRRDAQGREVYTPPKRTFSRVGCTARIYAEPTRLDDGRYIVETAGGQPFRIVDIVQQEPYVVAIVQVLRDVPAGPDSAQDKQLRQSEIESWQALNDVCWLACELFDKRSWLPLLMELDGKLHPLNKMKQYAPEQRVAGARPELTKAAANASWLKRQKFSWELVSVLRKGVPGLWDIEYTGNKLSDAAALKMMQDLDIQSRVSLAEEELKNARYVLRQHQRLRDIVHKRDQPPPGFA